MTGADDVRELAAGSRPEDWIPFADMGVWTSREDVQLRLVRHNQLDAEYRAPWTESIQAGCQSFSYVLYYGNSPVEYHVIVSVDDFRAHVPMPPNAGDPDGPYTVTPYQADLGRIITRDEQTFNAYLNRTGVQIQARNQGDGG
jgi:hypothetical protein